LDCPLDNSTQIFQTLKLPDQSISAQSHSVNSLQAIQAGWDKIITTSSSASSAAAAAAAAA
jgi:hypothetical protein